MLIVNAKKVAQTKMPAKILLPVVLILIVQMDTIRTKQGLVSRKLIVILLRIHLFVSKETLVFTSKFLPIKNL